MCNVCKQCVCKQCVMYASNVYASNVYASNVYAYIYCALIAISLGWGKATTFQLSNLNNGVRLGGVVHLLEVLVSAQAFWQFGFRFFINLPPSFFCKFHDFYETKLIMALALPSIKTASGMDLLPCSRKLQVDLTWTQLTCVFWKVLLTLQWRKLLLTSFALLLEVPNYWSMSAFCVHSTRGCLKHALQGFGRGFTKGYIVSSLAQFLLGVVLKRSHHKNICQALTRLRNQEYPYEELIFL